MTTPDTEWREVPAGAHGNQVAYLARWLGGLYRVVDPPIDDWRVVRRWPWSVWEGPASQRPLAEGVVPVRVGGEAEAKLAAERWTP